MAYSQAFSQAISSVGQALKYETALVPTGSHFVAVCMKGLDSPVSPISDTTLRPCCLTTVYTLRAGRRELHAPRSSARGREQQGLLSLRKRCSSH